jgi:hypothetical protein
VLSLDGQSGWSRAKELPTANGGIFSCLAMFNAVLVSSPVGPCLDLQLIRGKVVRATGVKPSDVAASHLMNKLLCAGMCLGAVGRRARRTSGPLFRVEPPTEEPDAGKPHVRFCGGPQPVYCPVEVYLKNPLAQIRNARCSIVLALGITFPSGAAGAVPPESMRVGDRELPVLTEEPIEDGVFVVRADEPLAKRHRQEMLSPLPPTSSHRRSF